MDRRRTARGARTGRLVYRSGCPLASALDVVGDRWSLLIVRGLMTGNGRYGDFLKDPERIATNILASRLTHLERAGLIERVAGRGGKAPGRYGLTRKGAELLPAMQALAEWGRAHLPGRWEPPAWFRTARPSDFWPNRGPDGSGRSSRKE